tara:strand:+ start:1857 stop:3068 length:1212 start_codon:yes stop_codon:yes gene_type:complete
MNYFIQSIFIALQNIRANPLHTFLSTLGIIIGVAALVGILALGDGLEHAGRNQISKTTSVQSFSFYSNAFTQVNGIRVPYKERPKITYTQAREIEGVYKDRAILEYVQNSTGEAVYVDSVIGIYLYGSLENGPKLLPNIKFIKGRYFTKHEVETAANVVVLTTQMAELWKDSVGALEGEIIWINESQFEVIGVIDVDMEGPRAIIPISVLDKENEFYPTVSMVVNNVEDIPIIKEEVATWLDEQFELGNEAFTMRSDDFWIEQLSEGILLFKLIMGAITGISVLVGGIGVMNVLLISVTERTKEIGVRKAAGAKKIDIVLQFMAESITISLVGSTLGWLIGMAGLFAFIPIVNSFVSLDFSIVINVQSVFIIFGIAILIGVCFGTYPAWRASQLNPIDAIRHE